MYKNSHVYYQPLLSLFVLITVLDFSASKIRLTVDFSQLTLQDARLLEDNDCQYKTFSGALALVAQKPWQVLQNERVNGPLPNHLLRGSCCYICTTHKTLTVYY